MFLAIEFRRAQLYSRYRQIFKQRTSRRYFQIGRQLDNQYEGEARPAGSIGNMYKRRMLGKVGQDDKEGLNDGRVEGESEYCMLLK